MKKLIRKEEKGFTLVEVIVVLVILAIMAAVLIPSLIGYINKAKSSTVKSDTRACVQAAQTLSSEQLAKGAGTAWVAPTPAEVKELAEVDGTVTTLTFSAASTTEAKGVVTALTYDSGTYTCAYTATANLSGVATHSYGEPVAK